MLFFSFFFFFCGGGGQFWGRGCLFVFSNQPLTGIDSDTFFFILELFKEAWECGYNNNIEKRVKITSGFSILICQHYALIDNFNVRFVVICLVFLFFVFFLI